MKKRNYFILLSILIALVLQIMPVPIQVDKYRPDWVLIVLSYWAMALPHRVNVGVAFISGLALDILMGTTLGVHSFSISLSVYVLAANYQRLRNYSVWQQAGIIGLLSAQFHMISFWLMYMIDDVEFRVAYMWPVVTSMALWPWVFWLLRKARRQLRIT